MLPLPEPYVRLSTHMALYSALAQGHGNITITRGDGTAKLIPEDLGFALRVLPPELRLLAGHQSPVAPQPFADRITPSASPRDIPFGSIVQDRFGSGPVPRPEQSLKVFEAVARTELIENLGCLAMPA